MRKTTYVLGMLVGWGAIACGAIADDGTTNPGQGPGPGPGPDATATSTTTTTPTTTTTSTTPPTLPNAGATGSYDLVFTAVKATQQGGGGPNPSGDPAPSQTTAVRLDLRANAGGGYDAAFTSRWGSTAHYDVAVSAAALTLTGTGGVNGNTSFGYVQDTWKSIVLPLDAKGNLTGAVSATGSEMVSAGDVLWELDLAGQGKIAGDATKPELRLDLEGFAGASLLPWEPLTVVAAEPVAPSDLTGSTTLGAKAGAAALAMSWDASGDEPITAWAGQSRFVARASDWTKVTQSDWLLGVSKSIDLIGLAGPNFQKVLAFQPMMPAASHVEFSSDVVLADPWGDIGIYGGGITGAMDARCETGSCLRIGPETMMGCTATSKGGMWSVLQRGATGHVAVRYRVLAKVQGGGIGQPYVYGSVLTVETATPGAASTDAMIDGNSLTFSTLASTIDGFDSATDWATLDVAVPGTGPIGVAIGIGRPGGCGQYGGGLPPPSSDVEILIDNVQPL